MAIHLSTRVQNISLGRTARGAQYRGCPRLGLVCNHYDFNIHCFLQNLRKTQSMRDMLMEYYDDYLWLTLHVA